VPYHLGSASVSGQYVSIFPNHRKVKCRLLSRTVPSSENEVYLNKPVISVVDDK